MVALTWCVEPIWRALTDNGEVQTEAPEPLPHVLLVWRPDLDCLWRTAGPAETAVLRAIALGATFAECCTAIAESGEPDPATTAAVLLQRWIADGLLAKNLREKS